MHSSVVKINSSWFQYLNVNKVKSLVLGVNTGWVYIVYNRAGGRLSTESTNSESTRKRLHKDKKQLREKDCHQQDQQEMGNYFNTHGIQRVNYSTL